MLQSKFKAGIIFPLILSLLMLVILFALIYFLVGKPDFNVVFLLTVPVCLFFLVWLVNGELRKKAIKVTIENDRIYIRNFVGLGRRKQFMFAEIDGYQISILPSEYRDFEYLYLIKKGNKVATISEYYHQNYFALKNVLTRKCRPISKRKFYLWDEIKTAFHF